MQHSGKIAWTTKRKKITRKISSTSETAEHDDTMANIDMKFAVAFPVIFLIFNLAYWFSLIM